MVAVERIGFYLDRLDAKEKKHRLKRLQQKMRRATAETLQAERNWALTNGYAERLSVEDRYVKHSKLPLAAASVATNSEKPRLPGRADVDERFDSEERCRDDDGRLYQREGEFEEREQYCAVRGVQGVISDRPINAMEDNTKLPITTTVVVEDNDENQDDVLKKAIADKVSETLQQLQRNATADPNTIKKLDIVVEVRHVSNDHRSTTSASTNSKPEIVSIKDGISATPGTTGEGRTTVSRGSARKGRHHQERGGPTQPWYERCHCYFDFE